MENLSNRIYIYGSNFEEDFSIISLFFMNLKYSSNCWFKFLDTEDSSLHYFSASWKSQPVKAPVTFTS